MDDRRITVTDDQIADFMRLHLSVQEIERSANYALGGGASRAAILSALAECAARLDALPRTMSLSQCPPGTTQVGDLCL